MALKGVVRRVVKFEVTVETTETVDGSRNISKLSLMFIQDGLMSRRVGLGRMSCIDDVVSTLSEVAGSLFHSRVETSSVNAEIRRTQV
jgi:hypothetical protein